MDSLKSDFSKTQNTKIMKQRTLWAMLSTLSHFGSIKTLDNTLHSGMIHTHCKKGVLLISKSDHEVKKISIPFESIISVQCPGIQITNKAKFKIDQEISKHSRSQKRQLQQWEGEEAGGLTFDISDYKSWDQFETNKKKFGFISTYDENLYTTPVPKISELTEEQVQRAKIVEKELSLSNFDKEEEEDEEAMFGAVLGSGRYEGVVIGKTEEKKKYKKIRKGIERNKKGDNSKGLIDETEGLSLILPKVEVKQEVQNEFRVFKQSKKPSPKVTLNNSKDFSKQPSPKIEKVPRVSDIEKNCECERKEEKCTSIIDMYLVGWSKCFKNN